MVPRQERLVENQNRFRRANQRLHERVVAMAHDDRTIPFICECADESCMEPVHVTSREYQNVREEQGRFLIINGHPTVDGEEIVEDRGDYAVVEKSSG
jgi:hypothetical protein